MLLWLDGMAHYATAQIHKKYTTKDDTNCTWSIAAEGRTANCLKKVSSVGTSHGYVEVAPLMNQDGPWTPTASGVAGFAFKVDDLDRITTAYQGDVSGRSIFELYEGQGPILAVSLNSNGTFGVYRRQEAAFGVNSIYLGSSIQGVRSNVWSYLEFKWLIHDSAGSFQIRLNNVLVFSFTGDTSASSFSHGYTNVWTVVRYLQLGSNAATAGGPHPTFWMCDSYLADLTGTGDDTRDFVGDCTVDKIVPDGAGNVAGWTPLAGNNWDNTEEVPPDDDTTYNSTATPATRDSYTFQNLPAGTVPIGFQVLIYARKETAGAAVLKPTYREGGVTYDGPGQGIATPDEYRYLIQPYDVNPATGLRATEAELNAAEFGVVKAE